MKLLKTELLLKTRNLRLVLEETCSEVVENLEPNPYLVSPSLPAFSSLEEDRNLPFALLDISTQ